MSKLYNYDETIDVDPLIIVEEINNVLPVRYNGIMESYVVTSPAQATHMLIITDDGQIMIDINCKNMYLLADSIVG